MPNRLHITEDWVDNRIAELEAELAKLRVVKSFFESMRPADPAPVANQPEAPNRDQPFDQLTIAEACEVVLRELDQPMTAQALAAALLERGFTTRSSNFSKAINNALNMSTMFVKENGRNWTLRFRR